MNLFERFCVKLHIKVFSEIYIIHKLTITFGQMKIIRKAIFLNYQDHNIYY